MPKTFFSSKSWMCQKYGEGLILTEYADTLHVQFTDEDGKHHLGIFTKSKHKDYMN